ncbi:MAG: hypothetical protein IKU51_02790 [Clostridia bacterium]|nr:hypothetical protein [Clostridia bacterium]
MKKVDVLFLYETKVRELESICLVKSELECRGYSTAILNTWNEIGHKGHKYSAKVIATPSMYNNGIYDFVKDICGDAPKIVNLQWEQIGPVGDEEKPDAWYILKGLANQCMHICWGPATYQRLLNRAHIDEDHLSVTGQIAMDFCRPEYRNYYKDKEILFAEYGIPLNKEANLFISSFSYVNLPKNLIKQSLFSEVDEFIKVSCESFKEMLVWFRQFLQRNAEQLLIYRPHPSEAYNTQLTALEQAFPGRFFVISDLSVKQWIAVADRVYTWFSTASAEAYAFDKPIAVLRPYPMPASLETTLLKNVEKIETYEAFENTLTEGCCHSLTDQDFSKYYRFDETPAFVRVADTIEKVYRDDRYCIIDDRPVTSVSPIQKVKTLLHAALTPVARLLPAHIHFLDKYRDEMVLDEYTLNRQQTAYASPEELQQIQEKLETVFYSKIKGKEGK